jgi:hypothetical protein
MSIIRTINVIFVVIRLIVGPKCRDTDAVFFQAQSARSEVNTTIKHDN